MSAKSRELKSEVVAFKRRRILEEATHLFFEQGYEGTTLDELAKQLRVTKPYLYSYFQNKSEILYDICQTGIQKSLAALDEALAKGGRPSARLESATAKVAAIVIETREYVTVYQREEKNLGAPEARRIREMRKQFDRKLTALLREGADAGEFSFGDPSVTATTIGGILSWLPTWYLPDGRLSAQQVIDHTVQMVLKLVRKD